MIRGVLQRWPLERVVLVADRGLLSLNNLQEIERLQAELDAQGAGVQVQYLLAVPASRNPALDWYASGQVILKPVTRSARIVSIYS